MIYVDSNVFIYPIIYDERSVEEAKRGALKIGLQLSSTSPPSIGLSNKS